VLHVAIHCNRIHILNHLFNRFRNHGSIVSNKRIHGKQKGYVKILTPHNESLTVSIGYNNTSKSY
jgi:hypothetical protein